MCVLRSIFNATLAVVCVVLAAETADARVDVVAIGAPLDSNVVDVFVPPTRAANTYAATARHVYRFDSQTNAWGRIFSTPTNAIRILGIEGYEKSSQPLYVVHEGGVDRTRDAGGEWKHTVPGGFRDIAEEFVGITVSPTDREVAVLATRHRAWHTATFGETWLPLPIPPQVGQISALAFTKSTVTELFLATDDALYWSKNLGEDWTRFELSNAAGALASTSQDYVDLVAQGKDSALYRFDVSRRKFLKLENALLKEPIAAVATDTNTAEHIWIGTNHSLLRYDVGSGQFEQIYESAQPISALVGHPRDESTIYFAEADQVKRLTRSDRAAGAPTVARSYVNMPTASLRGEIALVDTPGMDAQATALNTLLLSEPPLNVAVAAALRYADYSQGEIKSWKKNVRRRNLLPEFRASTGSRQWPADVFQTVNAGTTLVNDIHLNDREANLQSYEFEVRWDLGDILFDSDQVDVSEEARRRSAQRNELIREISDLYYERIAQMLDLQEEGPYLDKHARLLLALDIRKSTELLNQLCGQTLFRVR